MARPRKSMRYGEILNPLSVAELKVLKVEVAAEIRIKEREVLKEKQEEQARKVRDKIRIGQRIVFTERGKGQNPQKAEVVGIFTDKVQVLVDGRKRSIALTRIESVG